MRPISASGYIVGAIAWLAFAVLVAFESNCAEFGECDRIDLIMNSVISLGMLWPAWVLALIVSPDFPDKKGE